MARNFRQIYARQNQCKSKIQSICPDIDQSSGIYWFYRVDENGIKFAYIGQAKHLLDRVSQHLQEYDHIRTITEETWLILSY